MCDSSSLSLKFISYGSETVLLMRWQNKDSRHMRGIDDPDQLAG